MYENIYFHFINQIYINTMLLTILLLTLPISLNGFFCSAYCSPNQCTGITSSECTACDFPYILNVNTC